MLKVSMEAFSDEVIKIAVAKHLFSAPAKIKALAAANPRAALLVGGGVLGIGGAKIVGGGLDDWKLGRRVRKQMEEAQAQRG